MQELPSNWNIILIGGGGLFGVVTFVTKSLLDGKDIVIRQVEGDSKSWQNKSEELKEKYKTEREKTASLIQTIVELLKGIDAKQLDAIGVASLSQVLDLTKEYEETNILEMYEACERAGDWVKANQKICAEEACAAAFKKYPKIVRRSQRRKFKVDIENYLEWVSVCLYKGGERTVQISQFVPSPIVPSPDPYMAAISYLVNEKELGELTAKQKDFLREVLNRLNKKIQSEQVMIKL